jgi:hypothetical protein
MLARIARKGSAQGQRSAAPSSVAACAGPAMSKMKAAQKIKRTGKAHSASRRRIRDLMLATL